MKRRLIVWLVVIVAIAIAVVIWDHEKNVIPVVDIPTPIMPNPNAFDVWVEAAKSQKDFEKISYAISDSFRYKEAEKDKDRLDRAYSFEEKNAFIAENKQALTAFREGLQYEYYAPTARSFSALFPYLGPFRLLARLIELKSQAEAGQKKWGQAVNTSLDGIEFGVKMPRGGVLIHGLVGIDIQAIHRQHTWGYIEHLSGAEAKLAATRLEKIMAKQIPISETFTEEKWATQASLIESMKKRSIEKLFIQADYPMTFSLKCSLYLTSNRTIIKRYSENMDKVIEVSKYPEGDDRRNLAEPTGSDIVTRTLCPTFYRASFKWTTTDTQNRLILLSLVLQAYKADTGKYPAGLTDLVPKYLKKLPTDPFGANNSPFCYKRTGEKYLLYSVGPDHKDNGGKAIYNSTTGKSSRYIANPTSTGDIVVGINR